MSTSPAATPSPTTAAVADTRPNDGTNAIPALPGAPLLTTLTLNMAETAFQGDAEFLLFVNGQQVGGICTVTDTVIGGAGQAFQFTGAFGAAPTVAITLLDPTATVAGKVVGHRALFLRSLQYGSARYAIPTEFITASPKAITLTAGGRPTWRAGTLPPSNPPPPPPPITTTAPVMPQPGAPGQVVGLLLQNPTAAALAPRAITFASSFSEGQVPAGQRLVAMIDGAPVAVQLDVKTSYADGSIKTALVTLEQPAIAADSSLPVMLTLAGPAAAAAPVSLASLTDPAVYDLAVAITVHNADGTTTAFGVNAGALLRQALAAGTLGYWQQGPQATQVEISTRLTGALALTFDITRYADGTTATDVQFNNDLATAAGGALTYDAAITQDGVTSFQQSQITQHQYQTWDRQLYGTAAGAAMAAPAVNVQQDIAALEATGLIQNYDQSIGVPTAAITAEAARMAGGAAAGFGVLGNAGISEYMPMTGGRDDIGPTTDANAIWLETQNATAAQYALAQADAAGSIPWHIVDPTTGRYANLTASPSLSIPTLDPAIPSAAATGWSIDPAHEPDLDYTAYLMTGDRTYLDQLNAEASYDVLAYNTKFPQLGTNDGGALGRGIVATANTQVRGEAWSLREIVEAAAANPDGSAEKAYFTQVAVNNFQSLLAEAAGAREGALSGWIQGVYGYVAGEMAPWEEDYFASTVVLAAQLGIPGASTLMLWMTNFIAGRFLAGAEGFSPYDGAAYNLPLFAGSNPQTGAYQTWGQVEAAAQAAGNSYNGTWSNMQGDYGALAQVSLAGDITVTESPEAIQAYGWVYANLSQTQWPDSLYPNFEIAPRLADGNLLAANQVFIRNDTGATPLTVQEPTTADQLIYERGTAPVTLIGGPGIDLLFGGAGATTLIGGAAGDDLFAGTGATVFEAGAGSNYMQAGTGTAAADLFDLNPADVARDIIAGFRIGTDLLHVAGDAPGSAALASLIAGAASDGAGNTVLYLSATHTLTLAGLSPGQINSGLFS